MSRGLIMCAATASLLLGGSALGGERPTATPWAEERDTAPTDVITAGDALLEWILDHAHRAADGGGGIASAGAVGGLQSAADHIVDQQCPNGGWGWPHDDCGATYHNITGPIALGLLRAYELTGEQAYLDAIVAAGDYDLTGVFADSGDTAFGSFGPVFFHLLSGASGDPTYSDNAAMDFFDKLTAGTYGDPGASSFYPADTYDYLDRHKASRSGGLVNLRPWDMQYMPWVASLIGNADSTTPVDAVSQEDTFLNDAVLDGLDTLDDTLAWDTLGLAGGVHGLALNGTTAFPAISSPSHALISGITTLCDLADALVSLQNPNGSWYWNSTLGAPDASDEDTQATAYAVLALVAAQDEGCGPYDDEIAAARGWLKDMQDVDGGYFDYPGALTHNTEVEGEVLTALGLSGASLTLEIVDCPDDADAAAGYQIAVELWMRNLDSSATGFQAFLEYDTGVLSYNGGLSSYSGSPFSVNIQSIATAEVSAGEIRVDGSDVLGGAGTAADSLLATLVFDVDVDCSVTSVSFDLTQPFDSELSFEGVALSTNLVNMPPTTLDDAPPDISCPPDVAVQCIADADPGLAYGVATGGLGVYYNDNGGGENPANQAYYKMQFDGSTPGTGAPYVFDDTDLTGIPFSFHDLYSGLVWPESQYGFDLVVPAPTIDGSVLPPPLFAVDYDGVGPSSPAPVLWAFNDYKPHTPDITAGVVFNSIVRSPSPGSPLTDVVLTRQDLSLSGTIYTLDIEGVLTSDGIHHWYTPATPHSPMSNFGLSGLIYFGGTLTYDSFGDDGTDLVDFYAGPVTFTANYPSSATGIATALDTCTLFPVVTYMDVDDGGSGCPGDPLVITRTWTATDDCGNSSACVQTITVLDDTDPSFLSVPDDILVNADAGGCTATLTSAEIGEPTATDNCNPTVAITFVRSDGELNIDDPFDSADSPITITWTATDDCGNTETYDQIVTVNAVTEVTVTVDLIASVATTRCIHFVADDCGNTADVSMVFTDHDANALTPVRATATFEIGCGALTSLCGKDEQHSLWDDVGLNIVGIVYEADAVLVLEPGDNDNDGDVDINDVTFLVATFSDLALDGGCPFDGTRDADYTNNGAVGSTDYSALTPNWLAISSCPCTLAASGPLVTRLQVNEVDPWIAQRVDLNRDAVIDHRDVAIFERQHGLPSTLSRAIREAAERGTGPRYGSGH